MSLIIDKSWDKDTYIIDNYTATLYLKDGEIVRLYYDDVIYMKDAAIKFLKDRGTTFEELIEES